jgi:6-phosphogluconolactonase (cycloisomerase 2 family)
MKLRDRYSGARVMRAENGFRADSMIEIGTAERSMQRLLPTEKLQRFEGLAFSCSGKILAVATADTDTVHLFRRSSDGLFEGTPYCSISGPGSGLNYPHDLCFSRSGDNELLAVAQRAGAISLYQKNKGDDRFAARPVFEICGKKTKLNFSDAVAFVPPNNEYLAVCNLKSERIAFYRKIAGASPKFQIKPVFEIKHRSLSNPDGLAFSPNGEWLAVANHGNHTVSIFQRRHRVFPYRRLRYGPRPVAIIEDPGLRYPHSVAFTPRTNHLVVTNAGANYFSVYRPEPQGRKMRWSQAPVLRQTLGPENIFREVNAANKMEGGPKGIAISEDLLAVCSPEQGIKIYPLRESTPGGRIAQ